jgi:hypothetical protein
MAILVAGVDGCKAGWFVVLWNVDENAFAHRVVPDIWAVRALASAAQVIAVDIPIGFAAIVGQAPSSRNAGVANDDVLDAWRPAGPPAGPPWAWPRP